MNGVEFAAMVQWLKENVWIAAWLAPIVAVAVFFFEQRKTHFADVDWSRVLIRFAFLVALAFRFLPYISIVQQTSANTLMFMCLGWIMMDKKRN